MIYRTRFRFLGATSLGAILLAGSALSQSGVSPTLVNDGFEITIDGRDLTGADVPKTHATNRRRDIALRQAKVQVRLDGIDADPILNVSTQEGRAYFAAGQTVRFSSYTNYPRWITRSEVLIKDAETGRVVDRLPLSDGTGLWAVGTGMRGNFAYVLRVYDESGRFDETLPRPLNIGVRARGAHQADGETVAGGRGEDLTAVRNIPVRGGSVTVSGRDVPKGGAVSVMGRQVPVDAQGKFVAQEILPAGSYRVPVSVRGGGTPLDMTRPISIPRHDLFYVGLVDVTASKDLKNDLTSASGGKNTIRTDGRLAFYLKGKLDDTYRVTAALDTGEEELKNVFRTLYEKDPRSVLRRLDPDDFYPIYGDDATFEDDAPTSGKFYLRFDRNDSYAMWGDFYTVTPGTELLRNDRALYGATGVYRSEATTTAGARKTEASVYFAQPDSLPQQDVLRGTGGSAYFLRREDITTGSETITIEARDPVTGRITSRKELRYGADFEIDYIQGVVLLNAPLGSTAGSNSILGTTANSADHVYLVVQYEFTPTLATIDGFATGVRAQHWITDNLRIGATHQEEETDTADQTVEGIDLRYQVSDNTFLSAELARTKGPGFGRVSSTDGGLTFSNQSTTGLPAQAIGYDVVMQADLADLGVAGVEGSFGAFTRYRAAGFSTLNEDVTNDERSYGIHGDFQTSARLGFRFEAKSFEEDTARQEKTAEIEATYAVAPGWEVGAGVYYLDRQDPTAAAAKTGTRTDVGLRVTRELSDTGNVYAFAKGTVSRSGGIARDDRVGVGGTTQVGEKLSLFGEVSQGSSGFGADAGVTYAPTADDSYYVSYRLDPERDPGNVLRGNDDGTFVVGAKRRYSETLSGYGESRYDGFGRRQSLTSAYGVTYTPNAAYTVSAGVELGQVIDPAASDFERQAVSLGVAHADVDGWNWSLRGEVRLEDSADNSRDRESYLLTAASSYKVNPNWRFQSSLDAAISNSDQSTLLDGEYIEASIGYAYRPVENERLNALFKYTYLYDMAGPDQLSADGSSGAPKQRTHILSADVIYDLNARWSVGGKYGLRIGETAARGTSQFTSSTAQLAILRADYHLTHKWDLMVEARALADKEIKVVDTGLVGAVYRHVGRNMKIGIGYDSGTFSDDLRNQTYERQGVFLNLIGKF